MLYPFSLLVLVALAELFTLFLLKWKYGSDCSGNYRPRNTIMLVIERSLTVDAEPELSLEVQALLYAFELAAPHVKKGGTYKTRLAEQQELALGLVDWAICESDRGVGLLKELTKPDAMKA